MNVLLFQVCKHLGADAEPVFPSTFYPRSVYVISPESIEDGSDTSGSKISTEQLLCPRFAFSKPINYKRSQSRNFQEKKN